ncbi:hypothetical protein ACFWAP_00350 [Streptomyces goshikiensis]|uniref:hypothetical protein n=1 Tax=Streptomyces goshikiensis TaxID=1942 RepID=UPI003665F7BD
MSENVLSSGEFPTMGTSAATSFVVRQPTAGTLVPKSGNSKGGSSEAATANHRTNVLNRDVMGGRGVKVYREYTNAAQAAATGRNVKILPSKFSVDGK